MTEVLSPRAVESEQSQVWSVNHLREYLMAVSRESRMVLPFKQTPQKIQLNNAWHGTLNSLRGYTMLDGKERFVVICSDGRSVRVSSSPVVGTNDAVPDERVMEAINTSKKYYDVNQIIGDLHSHPLDKYPHKDATLGIHTYEDGLLSLGDLQQFLAHDRPSNAMVMGVADNDWNCFVFRSKETQDHSSTYFGNEGRDEFVEELMEKNGFWFPKMEEGRRAMLPKSSKSRIWKVYKAIAKKYKLTIYRGQKDGDLNRIYPEDSSTS